MTRYERDQLVDVLYKVYTANNQVNSVIGTLNNAISTIRANFVIDDEGPKVPSIEIMVTDSNNTISSFQNHVIPNLRYRIDSYVEEEDE